MADPTTKALDDLCDLIGQWVDESHLTSDVTVTPKLKVTLRTLSSDELCEAESVPFLSNPLAPRDTLEKYRLVHTLAFATVAVNGASIVPAADAPVDALTKARRRVYEAYVRLSPSSIDHMGTAWTDLMGKQREMATAIAEGQAVDRFFAPAAGKSS